MILFLNKNYWFFKIVDVTNPQHACKRPNILPPFISPRGWEIQNFSLILNQISNDGPAVTIGILMTFFHHNSLVLFSNCIFSRSVFFRKNKKNGSTLQYPQQCNAIWLFIFFVHNITIANEMEKSWKFLFR